MRVVNALQMQHIDRETIDRYGLRGDVLMERAGLCVVQKTLELYGDSRLFVVLCGPGNNGGDGLVVARELKNRGYPVIAYVFANPKNYKGDALENYNRALKYSVMVKEGREIVEQLPTLKLHRAVIIDALFGTGLTRPLEGIYAETINLINCLSMPVVSVDMPSGICSDTGRVMGTAVRAAHTVTFGLPKFGNLMHPGAAYGGSLSIHDLGFPRALTEKAGYACLVDRDSVYPFIPPRLPDSSKKNYGHVLLIAGSKGKTGAAVMAARSALRSGCGLLTLAMPASALQDVGSAILEEMTLALPEDNDGRIDIRALGILMRFAAKRRVSSIAIGPGLGVSKDTTELLKEILIQSTVPLVVDADGLNSLANGNARESLGSASSEVVITPHEGEMARLMGIDFIEDRISAAREFSTEAKVVTVLKGSPTLISDLKGSLFINTTGNPGMATGGAGDVLTGIIASLIAQGVSVLDASLLGVYLHGLAGDLAAKYQGMHSLIASDIINGLAEAFKETCSRPQA